MSEHVEPSSREEALREMDLSWEAWRAFLAELGARGQTTVRGSEGWTAAEAVAHVARWQAWCVGRVASLVAGERGEVPDIDAQNAAWAAQDRGIDWDAALAVADASFAAFREAVAGVSEEAWSRRLGRLVFLNTWHHYEEHMAWRAEGA